MKRVLPSLGATLIALTLAASIKAGAQEDKFKDVPAEHWAYQAVTELQQKKILVGYPDGRFSGKRVLTRYEFAVALKRALENIALIPGPKGEPGDTGPKGEKGDTGPKGESGAPGMTPQAVADLLKLTDMFKEELTGLGVNVKAVNGRLDTLAKDLDFINRRLDRMIQFNGDFFVGTRADQSRYGFLDYSGAARPGVKSPFTMVDSPHDFHLQTHANLPGGVKFNGDLVVSNYLSYLSAPGSPAILFGGPSIANHNGGPEQISLYQANLVIPIGAFGANTSLILGRFQNQVTPLTYYRPNTDAYFSLPWYDDGNFVQDGFKITSKFGSANTTLWAGSYTSLTTNIGDFLNRPIIGATVGPRFVSPFKPTDFTVPFTQGAGVANQSVGLHVGMPLFKFGELGLTYIDFSNTPSAFAGQITGTPIILPSFSNVTVYGANLKLNPIGRILINAEAAKSVTQTDFTHGDGLSNEDNNAFNLNLGYNSGPLGVQAGYQYIDPRFGAPGYWNKIGNWYNPTNIQGPFVRVKYNFTKNLTGLLGGDILAGARNRSIAFGGGVNGGLSTHDNFNRISAGLKFKACSRVNLNADWEGVFWDLSAGSSAIGMESHPMESYITLGAGVNLAGNTTLNFNYQIGALSNGAGFGGFSAGGASSNFTVFTTQLNTHF